MATRRLLLVTHSQSGSTAQLAEAVARGCRSPEIGGVDVRERHALEAGPDDVRWSEAIVLGTPENFGYMSGGMKVFFDRIYYSCLDDTRGLPYALFVKGGNDGRGAVEAIRRIVTGLAWREIRPPLVVAGQITDADLSAANELGAMVAAGLAFGIL